MISTSFKSVSKNKRSRPVGPCPKIARTDSLEHQVRHAKDAAGESVPLLDELFFLLDDPPPGGGDRWQQGADLCASRGITTSRVAVWRFYRAHVLEWRRQQMPVAAASRPDPKETVRLLDEARHLAAQRALDFLNDPQLAPSSLVGLLQCENQRRQVELARDEFTDRLAVRTRLEDREHYRRIEERMRDKHLEPAQTKFLRDVLARQLGVSPDSTS